MKIAIEHRAPTVARIAFALALISQAFACGAESESGKPDPPLECGPGTRPSAGGECLQAGLPADLPCPPGELGSGTECEPAGLPDAMPCAPGELLTGDACEPAGVPPAECGDGFVADGKRGCEPVLPDAACFAGQMAIPGEAICRDVAACGAGDYGDAPIDPDTQFVRGDYAGDDSDGSVERPWTKIQDAIDAAAAGAVVAIAAGSYAEDLHIGGRSVRLWGRCPAMVEVSGSDQAYAAVDVGDGADGTQIHEVAITGAALGILLIDSIDVLVDRVWVHDTADVGVVAQRHFSPTAIEVDGSLIERAGGEGLLADAAALTLDQTVIRDTVPTASLSGRGMMVHSQSMKKPGSATISRSWIRGNRDVAVVVAAAEATLTDTVLEDTIAAVEGGGWGLGIVSSGDHGSTVEVDRCVLRRNHEAAIVASGSVLTVAATVVEETKSHGIGVFGSMGRGISIQSEDGPRGLANISRSTVRGNRECGVATLGADLSLEAVLVDSTQEDAKGELGQGVAAQFFGNSATVTMRASRVRGSHEAGVALMGSEAHLESSLIEDTIPSKNGKDSQGASLGGRGITVQDDIGSGTRGSVTMKACLIRNNEKLGIFAEGSDLDIERCAVEDTRLSADGLGGRGIDVEDRPETGRRSVLKLVGSVVRRNHDVGVLVFGADAVIEDSVIEETDWMANGLGGSGLSVLADTDTGARSSLGMSRSKLRNNREGGLGVVESAALIESSVIEGNLPAKDGKYGRGINVEDTALVEGRSSLTVRSSVVRGNHDTGIVVFGADAIIEATLVEDTQPNDLGFFGGGIAAVASTDWSQRANVVISSSIVRDNRYVGVAVMAADASLDRTLVTGTVAREVDGLFGDGVALVSSNQQSPPVLKIKDTEISVNDRAGLANFGGSTEAGSDTLQCNAFDLEGEDFAGFSAEFQNLGDNRCGCPTANTDCQILRAGLQAPEAPEPSDGSAE